MRGLASDDRAIRERCHRTIAEIYWTPVYMYLRLHHKKPAAEAEDIAQSFFARVIEGGALLGHDPARGRFRSFLRRSLDHHVIDDYRKATAARRGGKLPAVDLADAEAQVAAASSVHDAFDRAWIERVVAVSIERTLDGLERRGKPVHAELFRRFHLEDPPAYAATAAELGITTTDVTNWLHVARREFRRVALALLKELTASPEEFAEEARDVFGIEIDRKDTAETA